ncbi:lysoplasmalogenase [Brumimicrobium glaciale]|uniref:Lysoplasmalogenase n=1 Tax=Brumimicrobium glaciale TaxID=200475 RepID=A0A4Q4KPV9_9FLAO|nr:lysoplasmalogenase [Brumimicrobium glaciale]RYM34574.1 lysoplasmalogenase [Brumimicrobium glaciale]
MILEAISLTILFSAIIAIFFRQRKNNKMFSIFKPLTTILIISLAAIMHLESPTTYSTLLIVSLIFALIGDIFLIGEKYFLQGLSSFLIAHIIFTVAFTDLFGFSWEILPLVILIIIGALFFNSLRKYLHKFTIPVLVYLIVILIMNWQAIGLLYHNQSFAIIGLAIGSIFFTFSDAIIAFDKFKKPIKNAEILILSTYWIAIYTFTIVGLYIDKL